MKLNENKIIIFFFITILIIIFLITSLFTDKFCSLYVDREFIENILVEAHGMVLDLFFIGIILVFLTNKYEKRREINTLHFKLDSKRYLYNDEGKYEIVSIIKLLNKKGIYKFDLHQCNLSKLELPFYKFKGSSIHATNFSHTNLKAADFSNTHGERPIFDHARIKGIIFKGADLERAEFNETKGRGANFSSSNIFRSNFKNSDFNNIDLRESKLNIVSFNDSDLKNSDFRDASFGNDISFLNTNLQSANFKNVKNLNISELIKAKNLSKAKFDDEIRTKLLDHDPNLEI